MGLISDSMESEVCVGSEADSQWSLEPAGQSGPDGATYPVLLPPTLGEHAEQNVSLATSSGTRFLLRDFVTSSCDSHTARQGLCHRNGSGTTEARPPERCPRPGTGGAFLSRHMANTTLSLNREVWVACVI